MTTKATKPGKLPSPPRAEGLLPQAFLGCLFLSEARPQPKWIGVLVYVLSMCLSPWGLRPETPDAAGRPARPTALFTFKWPRDFGMRFEGPRGVTRN